MARAPRTVSTGLLRIDKPSGPTSHDVVRQVRRAFGQREVGHTGTLDPMATGLMLVTLGRATRISRYLEATEKRYTAEIELGKATDSYDAEGAVTEEAHVPETLGQAEIEAALTQLRGRIAQAVPAYAAVKVGGEALYQKARRGESFDLPVREIEVFELRLLSYQRPRFRIQTRVSKGTYIRSLAVQIGALLGLPAHLTALRREQVGDHQVSDAVSLEALAEMGADTPLIGMADALAFLPSLQLDADGCTDVSFGRPLRVRQIMRYPRRGQPSEASPTVCLLDADGRLWAVARLTEAGLNGGPPEERALAYDCVFA